MMEPTVKLCINRNVALAMQVYAKQQGFPLNLTQSVNAALKTHLRTISATEETNEQNKL